MPDDFAASSLSARGSSAPCATVVVIGCEPASCGAMPVSERRALAGADAVLCETGIDAAILSLAPHGALVEAVMASGQPALPRVSAIARAAKLTSEGWRVVWLAAGDARGVAIDLAAAGVAVGECRAPDSDTMRPYEPHSLATAMNGLAG